jgi:hypothetical protein
MTIKALCLTRPLTVLALAAGLLGYASMAAGVAAGSPARFPGSRGVGYLRLAHLVPDTPAIDVYLYPAGQASATVVLRHLGYGGFSPYQSVASGDYMVAMRAASAAPTATPVLSVTVDVVAGHAYTVAGLGPRSGMRLRVLTDQLRCPPGLAMVQVIQASLQQPEVTVTVGRQPLSRDQAFASITRYRVVHPGTWTVQAAGTSEHASARVTLAAGSIETLVVQDAPGHLTVSTLEDAAASKVVPDGAAAPGFSGTAPKPGMSPILWLALACAGLLLLTMAGVVRFRQFRWARRAAAHVR